MTATELNYDFFAPPEIHFGWGRRAEIGAIARKFGRRAFVISGSRQLKASGRLDEISAVLQSAGVDSISLAEIHREPLVADVDQTTLQLLSHSPSSGDMLVAIGGGSAIDLAKAVAALATNAQTANGSATSVRDYLEGVGRGLKINRPPLPVLAMPTTAGTGSEATKNAVISSFDPPFKKSLRSDLMLPRAVLVDPELTISMPPAVTAQTGMDAITQLIESYISCRAKPIPRALALQGLNLALPAIAVAFHHPTDRAAREAMAHAALLSGMCLANAGLGMAHGVAAALGVISGLPHGLACAVMLPHTLRANRNIALADLAELERAVTNTPDSDDNLAADRFIARVDWLCGELNIPDRLSPLGVMREQISELVAASHGNSMNGNPRVIADDELTALLEAML